MTIHYSVVAKLHRGGLTMQPGINTRHKLSSVPLPGHSVEVRPCFQRQHMVSADEQRGGGGDRQSKLSSHPAKHTVTRAPNMV